MSTTIDALRNLGLKVNDKVPTSNYVNNVINEIANDYEGGGSGGGGSENAVEFIDLGTIAFSPASNDANLFEATKSLSASELTEIQNAAGNKALKLNISMEGSDVPAMLMPVLGSADANIFAWGSQGNSVYSTLILSATLTSNDDLYLTMYMPSNIGIPMPMNEGSPLGGVSQDYTLVDHYSSGSHNYTWEEAAPNGMSNPMTAAGDIIIGGTSGAPTRLAKGTQGQVLSVGSNGLEWANASSGGGGSSSDYISFAFDNDAPTVSNGTYIYTRSITATEYAAMQNAKFALIQNTVAIYETVICPVVSSTTTTAATPTFYTSIYDGSAYTLVQVKSAKGGTSFLPTYTLTVEIEITM